MSTYAYLGLLLIGALGVNTVIMESLQVGWPGVAAGFAADGILVIAAFLTLRQTRSDLAPLGLRKPRL